MKTKVKDLKTAVYVRVSTSEQSTEAQMEAISAFLRIRGLENVQVYEDHGYSGKNDARPAFKTLLNDVKEGKVACVVVFKLDRLFRSLSDLLGTLAILKQHDCTFASVTEQLDLTNAMGRFVMHVMGAFAEFERNLIIERTKAGMKAAIARGAKPGRPTKVGKELKERVIKHIEEGLTHRSIALLEGISTASIYRIHREHGKALDRVTGVMSADNSAYNTKIAIEDMWYMKKD